MKNNLQHLFTQKKQNLLSLFFTAGYPEINSAPAIIEAAQACGIDFLEVGMPYSDPLADGPLIQHCNQIALNNGMHIDLLFDQLQAIRHKTQIPLLLMGYLNPVLQYGMEAFCRKAAACGIAGLILPDLPLEEYLMHYQALFQQYKLSFVLLISPQTSDERIRRIDQHSNTFIYAVSSAATTGSQQDFGQIQQNYFERIKSLNLKNPIIAGFGIHNAQTLQQAWSHTQGAICGSAFLKHLAQQPQPDRALQSLFEDLGIHDLLSKPNKLR